MEEFKCQYCGKKLIISMVFCFSCVDRNSLINMKFYPPKPTLISIKQDLVQRLEKSGEYVVEPKFNGNRLILKRFSQGKYEFWNRHGEMFKRFSYSYNSLINELDKILWDGFCVLDGELMHFRTKNVKNTIILFDVIVWNGKICEEAFIERRKLLEKILSPPGLLNVSNLNLDKFRNLLNNSHILISPQWRNNFREIFNKLIEIEEIEGIVIKKSNAKLELGINGSPIVRSMFKARKPSNSYKF